ncbi:MAG: M13 family metallopeptidase, partial [Acinetobacter sp.]
MKTIFVKSLLSITLMSPFITTMAATYQLQTAVNQKSSGIDKQSIDHATRTQDDFYQHVNGTWLKNTEIPADKARWGSFNQLQDQTVQQIQQIINSLSQKKSSENSVEGKISALYNSFMDEKTIEALGLKPLQPELIKIQKLQNKKDIASLLAHYERIGVSKPFGMGIDQDMKQSTIMIVQLGQSGLSLPDRDYYLKDDKKFVDIRQQYLKYIERMLTLTGDQQAAEHAQAILALETKIAQYQWTNVQNRDTAKRYNKYKLSELSTLVPSFDWETYLKETGVSGKVETIQVDQPSYFKGLNTLLAETPIQTWQIYFKWHLINDFAPLLSKAYATNSFNFYSTTLRDVKEQEPRWKRGVALVNGILGEGLGQLYVQQYFTADKKQRMDLLVANLIKAYDQSIDQLDWMSPATKIQARKKLTNLAIKIGYPKKWRDYSALRIEKNDVIGNSIRASEFEHNYELNKLGKPVDRAEWYMTPQTVNAYYNPSLNEIVFPAAILQPPFFNMNADDAVNYGGIGAVIGHEISHAFDDQGSQFDELGNMRNWWTEEDHKRFKEKTQALVNQYNAYEPISGYHVNGELTLGENIADNAGLAIAYK